MALFMSLRSPFQPKAPPCDASRPAVPCNVLILDLPECFLVVLVCDSAPVQTFFLSKETTRVALSGFPDPEVTPYLYGILHSRLC